MKAHAIPVITWQTGMWFTLLLQAAAMSGADACIDIDDVMS